MHAGSTIHRLPPQAKVLALVLFVFAVAATPPDSFGAFGSHALLLVVVDRIAGVGSRHVASRLTIEIPFVLFALLLPFVGSGETFEFLGVSLHTEGVWAAWNIAVKATLCLTASILLAATTTGTDILHGLERLRTPRVMTAIAGFMLRYADVVTGEMRRMSIARRSRAYEPGWIWELRAIATGAGVLLIRAFERGERVYLAMASRGFSGHMPSLGSDASTPRDWFRSLALPLMAVGIACYARFSA